MQTELLFLYCFYSCATCLGLYDTVLNYADWDDKESTQVRVPGPAKLPGIWTPGFGVAGGGRPLASERLKE